MVVPVYVVIKVIVDWKPRVASTSRLHWCKGATGDEENNRNKPLG